MAEAVLGNPTTVNASATAKAQDKRTFPIASLLQYQPDGGSLVMYATQACDEASYRANCRLPAKPDIDEESSLAKRRFRAAHTAAISDSALMIVSLVRQSTP
jgi:hypothetical protein